MEFFERAHKAKSSRKESKSDEAKKKQSKQMLYGYKLSNNELIKKSAELKNYFDDSTSVSGFSDLTLSNSSCDPDIPHGTNNASHQNITSSDINDLSLSNTSDDRNKDRDGSLSLSMESLSEYDEDEQSLPLDPCKELVSSHSEVSDEDTSLDDSVEMSLESASDGSDFEPDGALTAEILKRLDKTEKIVKQKKLQKRKKVKKDEPKVEIKYKGPYNPNRDEETCKEFDEIDNYEIENIKSTKQKKRNVESRNSNKTEVIDLSDQSSIDDKDVVSVSSLQGNKEENTNGESDESQPFISVLAADVPSQSLDEIIGGYRHSTVKNLPSETHNFVYSNQTSDFFSTEDIRVEDVTIEEDADSLVPEIDDDRTLEDVEINTEVDTSTNLPNEESTTYDETMQTEETFERELSTDSLDTTLGNPVKVYNLRSQCVFVLKHPGTIYVHGKLKVKVLGGTVEVLGYTLKEKPCEIYAPNYNYAQYIRTVENQNVYYGLFGKLTGAGLSVSDAEEIVTTIGHHDGVILLKPLKSRKMDYVENNFSIADLFSKPSKNIENSFMKTSELLGCSLYLSRPWKVFEENVSWKKAIKCGRQQQSRGVLCGGKGVGKSTFLRYYVNKLVADGPVLVVDLDPGQCEFTVAGNVSATVVHDPLLGPNFTHLRTPEFMLNIGMINTMDNPRRYAAAIEELISYCSTDENLRNMRWVVNTMGMTNAMGLKFMTLTLLHTNPTFILQIDSKNDKKRFDFHLYSNTVKQLYFEDYRRDQLFSNVNAAENLDYVFLISHHTENSVKSNYSLAPRDERYLNFLAYFGELLTAGSDNILGIVPYEVSLKDLNIGLNVNIGRDALAQVINGKVVALCRHRAGAATRARVFTLADKPLHCLGHGLIRGIDWEKDLLYLVTPVSGQVLGEVDTLAYADWTPELRATESALPPGTAVPYRTASAYQQRQFMFAPKRRFNPLQLIKMSRNA